MALLERLRKLGGARAALLALVGSAMTGCVIFDALGAKEQRFAFSHERHVTEEGLECSGCHSQAADAQLPALPSERSCALCHDEIDADKPAERKVAALFVDKRYRAAHVNVNALSDDVVFPHARHAAEGVLECAQCHVGIEGNQDVLELERPSMAGCVQCHAEREVAAECSTCHLEIRADARPPSHDRLWLRGHGAAACAGSERASDTCSLCHQESSCATCHMELAPTSHTNYWRLRGHGISAKLDRQSCATCHREDACTSCHADSAPLNHTGAWGAPTDRHCVTCHFPVENEGCATCHHGTPSHDLATPLPPSHTPGMNCRMCHGVGQPLPHVDNGDSCSLCHR